MSNFSRDKRWKNRMFSESTPPESTVSADLTGLKKIPDTRSGNRNASVPPEAPQTEESGYRKSMISNPAYRAASKRRSGSDDFRIARMSMRILSPSTS